MDKYISLTSRVLNAVGGIVLIAMLTLVVADILGIKVFSHPIPGGIEITAFLAVLVIGCAIAWTQVLRGHIRVDFFTMKLPERPQAALEAFMNLLGVIFFALLTWRTWDYAQTLQASGEVSMTQKIPFYPFIYALAVCFFVMILVLILDMCKSILKAGKKWNP
jgi:TRAP-type C4-dicarboxylate transport system permease small subunit